MAEEDAIFLTREYKNLLDEMIRWYRSQPKIRSYHRPTDEEDDVGFYMGRVVDTITPMTPNTTGTGTGTVVNDDIPGWGVCEIYKVFQNSDEPGDVSIQPAGFSRVVYSLSSEEIASDQWIEISQDNFGTFWVDLPNTGSNSLGVVTRDVRFSSLASDPDYLQADPFFLMFDRRDAGLKGLAEHDTFGQPFTLVTQEYADWDDSWQGTSLYRPGIIVDDFQRMHGVKQFDSGIQVPNGSSNTHGAISYVSLNPLESNTDSPNESLDLTASFATASYPFDSISTWQVIRHTLDTSNPSNSFNHSLLELKWYENTIHSIDASTLTIKQPSTSAVPYAIGMTTQGSLFDSRRPNTGAFFVFNLFNYFVGKTEDVVVSTPTGSRTLNFVGGIYVDQSGVPPDTGTGSPVPPTSGTGTGTGTGTNSDPGVCTNCIGQTPTGWTFNLPNTFTGACSVLNGVWNLTHTFPCTWHQQRGTAEAYIFFTGFPVKLRLTLVINGTAVLSFDFDNWESTDQNCCTTRTAVAGISNGTCNNSEIPLILPLTPVC